MRQSLLLCFQHPLGTVYGGYELPSPGSGEGLGVRTGAPSWNDALSGAPPLRPVSLGPLGRLPAAPGRFMLAGSLPEAELPSPNLGEGLVVRFAAPRFSTTR
jgi:hypothetical protein